jgi:glutamyl-tRNA reductase
VMARSVVQALRGLPAPVDVTVVARRPEMVDAPGVDVRHFDSAPDVLAAFPAVISATSAKRRPVADEVMARSLSDRTGKLTLVDMAMPPDFHPPTDAAVEYFNIDDLARMADRRPRSEDADGYVEAAAADAYRKYAVSSEVGPVIGAMMSRADEVVESVVERFSGRLEDPSDVETLRQAAHTVARRLMAQPVEVAKQGESLETIASLFLDNRE